MFRGVGFGFFFCLFLRFHCALDLYFGGEGSLGARLFPLVITRHQKYCSDIFSVSVWFTIRHHDLIKRKHECTDHENTPQLHKISKPATLLNHHEPIQRQLAPRQGHVRLHPRRVLRLLRLPPPLRTRRTRGINQRHVRSRN